MKRAEFKDLIDPERFTPFIITTKSGYVISIGPELRAHTLAGASTLIVMDADGHFIHIPYHAIDNVYQTQQ